MANRSVSGSPSRGSVGDGVPAVRRPARLSQEMQQDINMRACLKEMHDAINLIEDPATSAAVRERLENLEECMYDNDDWAKSSAMDRVLRVAILGKPKCGQTQLINRFLSGSVDGEGKGHKNMMQLVSGMDRPVFTSMGRKHKTVVPCNGAERTLLLRTSSGDPSPQVLWWADAFVIAFTLADRDSFTALERTYSKAMQFRHRAGLPFIAVGIDGLGDSPAVMSNQEAEMMCSLLPGVTFIPVNPATGHNVHRLFHDVVHEIVEFVLPDQDGLDQLDRVGQLDAVSKPVAPPSPMSQDLGHGRSIPIIQGVLKKRPKTNPAGKSMSSQKRWVTLTQGGFTYYPSLQEYMNNAAGKSISLFGTTVKVPRGKSRKTGGHNTPLRHSKTFSIVSMTGTTWTFEAKDELECSHWVAAIEKEIEGCFTRTQSEGAKNTLKTGNPQYDVLSEADLARIKAVEGNNRCADCGASDPAWASLNLAVLTCIECSGIHRNLGVHISRMRSLSLDDWKASHVDVLCAVGNAKANKVWEAAYPGSKPHSSSTRDEKEKWIFDKYSHKKFLAPLEGPAKVLLLGVAADNRVTLEKLNALAHCTKEELKFSSSADGRTSLHLASKNGDALWTQLLIWDGADVNATDVHGRTPLFYAKHHEKGAGTTDISSLLTEAGCRGPGKGSLGSLLTVPRTSMVPRVPEVRSATDLAATTTPNQSLLVEPDTEAASQADADGASRYSTPAQEPGSAHLESDLGRNDSFAWFDDDHVDVLAKTREALEHGHTGGATALVHEDPSGRKNTVFERPTEAINRVLGRKAEPKPEPGSSMAGSGSGPGRQLPKPPPLSLNRSDSRNLMAVSGHAPPEEYSPTLARRDGAVSPSSPKRRRARTVNSTTLEALPNSFV